VECQLQSLREFVETVPEGHSSGSARDKRERGPVQGEHVTMLMQGRGRTRLEMHSAGLLWK